MRGKGQSGLCFTDVSGSVFLRIQPLPRKISVRQKASHENTFGKCLVKTISRTVFNAGLRGGACTLMYTVSPGRGYWAPYLGHPTGWPGDHILGEQYWQLLFCWTHLGMLLQVRGFQTLSCCWYGKAPPEDTACTEVTSILEKGVYSWCGHEESQPQSRTSLQSLGSKDKKPL